jgi:hypothetical protein
MDLNPVRVRKVPDTAYSFKVQLRAKSFHAPSGLGVVVTFDQHAKMIDPGALSSSRLADNKNARAKRENKLAFGALHLQAT